jgi:WD40 repeat protein
MISKRTGLLEAIQVPSSPFPGLRPFEFQESHLFFGRDGQIEKLLDKLIRTRFLAVVGTSGSGKSSLARAGLMPALRGGMMTGAGSNWRIAVMRPSNDPIGNLARALNAPDVFGSDDTENVAIQIAVAEATLRLGSRGLIETVRQNVMPETENLLVVVDQFEELFRFAREARKARTDAGSVPRAVASGSPVEERDYDNEAAAFVKLLLEAVKPGVDGQREANIYVVLTMRSDFLGDCSQFWDLPEAINESQYLIPRLTRDQLREVIEGPVTVGGGQIAPRLVNQLLNDISDNQDQLPILQHALMRTWDEWKNPRHEHQSFSKVIDLCCYEEIGGMADALSEHADEAFDELPDDRGRMVAEKMFKCLTEKGEDNREIRRPVELHKLCAVAEANELEVKAVIETFRQSGRSFLMPPPGTALNEATLIDISHESLIRVWKQLQRWVNEEAESAAIYRRLAETAELRESRRAELWRGADLESALEWRKKVQPTEAWAQRYHPHFAGAMDFLFASERKRDEDRAKEEQQQREEAERAKRELALAQVAAEAQRQAAEAERQRAEAQAKAASRLRRLIVALIAVALLALLAAGIAFLAYSSANAEKAHATRQKEIAEGEKVKADVAKKEALDQKAIADQKKEEAEKEKQRAEENQKKAEEQASIVQRQTLAANEAKTEAERQKGLADDSTFIANMNLAGSESERGNHRRVFELLDAYLPANNIRPEQEDRRSFYWYYLWRQNYRDYPLAGHSNSVNSVAFSPDGRTLATTSGDNSIKLWDAQSRKELTHLTGHGSTVLSVAFSPDGRTLASASEDKSVKLWDVQSRKELATLTGHGSFVRSVAFSLDGRTLASASDDKSVKLWDAQSRKELATLTGHGSYVRSVAFSPDGRTLASASWDKLIKLWDVQSRKELATLTGHGSFVRSVAFSPDGRTLASASDDKSVKLWDAQRWKELATLTGHGLFVLSVAFSPDGRTLASASADKSVKLWDGATDKDVADYRPRK